MTQTVVHIDSLRIDGFSQNDARRAADVFEQTLGALLTDHGLPIGTSARDLERIDLGKLPTSATTPDGMGRELAHLLFARVWR